MNLLDNIVEAAQEHLLENQSILQDVKESIDQLGWGYLETLEGESKLAHAAFHKMAYSFLMGIVKLFRWH